MKVNVVLPFINLTGGIRVLLDYANWLHDAGHDVRVIFPTWPYRFQYTARQQWTECHKHRRLQRVAWFDLRCTLIRAPLIRSVFIPGADLVLATAWPTVPDVARLPRRCGRKVHIVMHHESGTGPERAIQRIYGYPFHRIAFSHFVERTIGERFGCRIAEVVPNGVDTALFFPDGVPEPRTVLFLYHPDPRKGAADGVEALTRLRTRLSPLRVRACGTVRPDRLPDWMPFEFHPDDGRLRQLYSTSTALLYPSRYEGFGLPPLEAMACGCPSVTTTVGALPEYARDGRDALFVAPGDVASMVDRLEVLLRDTLLRERLSVAGRGTARRFSVENVAPLFATALEHAMQLA